MKVNEYNGSFLYLLGLGFIASLVSILLLNKAFPLFTSHTIYFCQKFITSAFFQIPHLVPNTLTSVLVFILIIGVISFMVQLSRTRRLISKLLLNRISPSVKLQRMNKALGLEGKIFIIKDGNLFSFCFGILKPRIIISDGLIKSLSYKELEAVLLHEKAHLKNFDPLKMIIGKTIASMFFFLPIFSELNKNMNATNEILADRFTINAQQNASYLKGALRKILTRPQIRFATVPAISNSDHLEIRIHKLKNLTERDHFRVSYFSTLTILLFFALSWFVLKTPVNAFQIEEEHDPSYFMCSSDDSCRQECQNNAQTTVSTPEELFSPQKPTYKYQSSQK